MSDKKTIRAILFLMLLTSIRQNQQKSEVIYAIDNIIDCVNNAGNEKHEAKIRFAKGADKNIKRIGYENLILSIKARYGRIISYAPPAMLSPPRMASYQILGEKGRGTIILGLEADDSVSYLQFSDPAPIIPQPKRNSKPMRLPFRGRWVVDQGGSNPDQNPHMESGDRASRFAVDFSRTEADGYSFRGDNSKLENYISFGNEILAVADGVVVSVVDGSPDNRPFTVNRTNTAGNLVIIKHANHEFSRYCHLKYNSTRVKVGEKVSSGQVIGQCGNSGFSSMPHLHFDLTNTEVDFDATGFMPYFKDVILLREGMRTIEMDYSPVRNDAVESQG